MIKRTNRKPKPKIELDEVALRLTGIMISAAKAVAPVAPLILKSRPKLAAAIKVLSIIADELETVKKGKKS